MSTRVQFGSNACLVLCSGLDEEGEICVTVFDDSQTDRSEEFINRDDALSIIRHLADVFEIKAPGYCA